MRDRTENQIKLTLIRHGAVQSNLEHRYLGKTEESLCPEGICVLQRYMEEGLYPAVGCVFVSPMKRCLETAELLYPEVPEYVIPEWTEMDFGTFEGKNYEELQGDAAYQSWVDSYGNLPFPQGEDREAFTARCRLGVERMLGILQKMDFCETEIALIVHGGTIMALLSTYYGGSYYAYQVSNAEGYRTMLQVGAQGVRMSRPELLCKDGSKK